MSRGPAGTAKTRAAAAAAAAATAPTAKKVAAAGNHKSYAHNHQQRQFARGGLPNKRQRHHLPSASSAATAAGVAVAGAPWVGGSADVSAESSDEEGETMAGARLRLRTESGMASDAAGEEDGDDDDDDEDDDDEEGEEQEGEEMEEPPEYVLDMTANGQKKRIPAFVRKLRSMLDAKDVTLIKWTSDGEAFRVLDSMAFSKQVLPNYFKHNNWQSFIRQLNIYGFMKLSEAAKLEGVSSAPQSDWSFRHPLFLRKHPRRMEEIKRRTPKEPKPGMMDGEHAWNMVKAARAASQSATSSTSPSACPSANAGAGKSNKRKPTLVNGGSGSGSVSSSSSNVDAGHSSLVATGNSKPSFASSSASSSSSNLGSAGGSAASSASTSATTVEDSASAAGGDDGSDKDSSALPLTKPDANGAYDAGVEEEEEDDVADAMEEDQVVSTALDGNFTAASLNRQVIAMQKQMNGMQRSMAQMAKAQARAIALTAGVLATQLAGMDSSVSSIQDLQSSLSQWQNACEAAISRSRHPGMGSLTLRIPKRRSSSKRKASNGHQSDAGSSDDEGAGSEDDAAAEVSGTFANSSNIVGFGLSEPPPPLLQHGAPLPDPAAAAGFMPADGLQVGVPSQVPMFGYGYGSLSSLYGAPDDSEVEGAAPLPDVLTYDGAADGDDQAYPAAKRRKR